MLDLETMSTQSNAAITSIGAVAFNKDGIIPDTEFYVEIDLESAVEEGKGHLCPNTVKWWLSQSKEAQKMYEGNNKLKVGDALIQFSTYLNNFGYDKSNLFLWGNGSDFDNVILASQYKRLAIKQPWFYSRNCCYRTICNLFDLPKPEKTGVHHSAIDDAVWQATRLYPILEKIIY